MVVVYDVLCGQGKTSFMMKDLEKNPRKNIIYVTPYLKECYRFSGLKEKDNRFVLDQNHPLSFLSFKTPTNRNKKGSKLFSLKNLLEKKENIVTTHSLFLSITKDMNHLLKDYTLILDETVQTYEILQIQKDVNWCIKNKIIKVNPDQTLSFFRENLVSTDSPELLCESRYEDIALLCDSGQLLYIKETPILFLDKNLITTPKEVIILTYLFKHSEMYFFFNKNNIPFEIRSLYGAKRSTDVADLIHVLPDKKMNYVGYKNTLSSSNLKSSESLVICKELGKNLFNFFSNKVKTTKSDRVWTTYSHCRYKVTRSRFQEQFIPFNTRATNEFKEATNLAFLLNLYFNPFEKTLLTALGYGFVEEHFVISTLIQFIFRSAVREGKEVNLYLPSPRMREYLEKWKKGEYDYV